jgi:hypothetical protein
MYASRSSQNGMCDEFSKITCVEFSWGDASPRHADDAGPDAMPGFHHRMRRPEHSGNGGGPGRPPPSTF